MIFSPCILFSNSLFILIKVCEPFEFQKSAIIHKRSKSFFDQIYISYVLFSFIDVSDTDEEQ